MAVERVGLAPGGAAAAGAVDLHEVLALCQRIAGTGGLEIEGQQDGQLLCRHGHGATGLAVDDRDRRAPGALAGDREVVRAVAHRRAQPAIGGSVALAGAVRLGRVLAGDGVHPSPAPVARRSARRCGRARECRGRRSRRSARRRRERSAPAGTRRSWARASVRPVSISGISSASRDSRSKAHRSAAPRSARARTDRPPSARRRGAWARSRRSAPVPERVCVGREHGQRGAVGGGEVELDTVDATEDEALGGERALVPDTAVGELLQAQVVLRHVGADAQVPLGALDQLDGVVAAPAEAVLDLNRGERRLAGLAPVDGSRPAVDQARLQQLQEQPLRPAIHEGVGAEERAVPVEGESEALELPGHVRRRSR